MAVGALGFSTASFYLCEPREVELAIEGYREKQETDFYYSQIAMTNAVGVFMGGKKFKQVNPFEKKKRAETVTVESKAATFDFLHNKFERRGSEK